jgi:hypothetical protein
MSEFLTTNLTPPIRSIAAETSLLIATNDIIPMKKKSILKSSEKKLRERSSSESSSTSTSSSSPSLASPSDHQDPYDDVSSIDEPNTDWAQLQLRLHTIRRLCMILYSIEFIRYNQRLQSFYLIFSTS